MAKSIKNKKQPMSQLNYIAQLAQGENQTFNEVKLVDTLNVGQWVYNDVGRYYALIQRAFDPTKVHVMGQVEGGVSVIPVTNGSYLMGYISFYASEWDTNVMSLEIKCVDVDHQPIELAALIGTSKIYLPEVKYFT